MLTELTMDDGVVRFSCSKAKKTPKPFLVIKVEGATWSISCHCAGLRRWNEEHTCSTPEEAQKAAAECFVKRVGKI